MNTRTLKKRKIKEEMCIDDLDVNGRLSVQEKMEAKEEKICNICYDKLEEKNFSITKCGHSFCNGCFLEALSRKKECPCCRTEIFDLHKNKKRMSLSKATELAKVNLSYLFRNNYKDLIENSIFNIFEESLNFKCSCELVNCSNNKIHFEQDEINETLKNIQKLKEKSVFRHKLWIFIKDLCLHNSINQNIITRHFYEKTND